MNKSEKKLRRLQAALFGIIDVEVPEKRTCLRCDKLFLTTRGVRVCNKCHDKERYRDAGMPYIYAVRDMLRRMIR